MANSFVAACVQLNSGDDIAENIRKASGLIAKAAAAGAEFITLPENAFLMGAGEEQKVAAGVVMEKHLAVIGMIELAKKLGVWLLFGVAAKGLDKLKNRSILLNDKGEIVTYYDKIHLFDVDIEGGESHRESDLYEAGDSAVLADLPWAKLGMTICYDLRFPSLFRELAKAGAQIISVPSAFTFKTGEAHWHSLLRARAIENTSYIIAPAQCGHHPRGRRTYGHSMIIDPWGEILTEASENDEEFIIVKIDLDRLVKLRLSLPSLNHDKEFKFS